MTKLSPLQKEIFERFRIGQIARKVASDLLGDALFLDLVAEEQRKPPPQLYKKVKPLGHHLFITLVQVKPVGKNRRWLSVGVVLNKEGKIIYQFQTPMDSKTATAMYMRRISVMWFDEADRKELRMLTESVGGCKLNEKVSLYAPLYTTPWIRYSRNPSELAIGARAKIESDGAQIKIVKFDTKNERIISNKNRTHVATEWAKILAKLPAIDVPQPLTVLGSK